jgi:hypothetical protein
MATAQTLLDLRNSMGSRMARAAATLLWNSSGIIPQLRFIPHNALAYDWTQEGGLPGVGGRGLNEAFDDSAAAEGAPDSPKITGLAILGGKIKTDIVHIEQKGQAARARRIEKKIKAASKMFDRLFISGDAAANPRKAFNGLKRKLGADRTLTIAANGALPTYKAVVELLDAVDGPNTEKRLIMNRTARRLLSDDVLANAPGGSVLDVGKQLQTFEGAGIVLLEKDETETEILQFNETVGGSNACSSIYCVRFGGETEETGVQGITGLKGTINARGPIDFGEYHADYIHFVTSIEVFDKYSAARLQGIKAA